LTLALTEIYGIDATPDLVRELRSGRPAGIHLLRRNIETPEQVAELVADLKAELGDDLEIAVRHEGGAVTPFVRGVTSFPGLEALEEAANPVLAREVGRTMGSELAAMGITMNLVPDDRPMAREMALGLRCVGIKAGEGTIVAGKAKEPDEEEGASLAAAIASAALRVERDPSGLLPIPSGRRVGLLLPRLGDVADRVPIADGLRATAALMRPRVGASVAVLEVAVQPDEKTTAMAVDWMAGQETAVFFCFDAHRFAGQRRLLEGLSRRCERLAVVTIGNSGDREFVGGRAAIVRTCGFQEVQLLAALEALFQSAPKVAKRK
jgi:hypothetical protein